MRPLKTAALFLIITALCPPAFASPWAEKPGYFSRTGGKFLFGLKHTVFSWLTPWTEANEHGYDDEWRGFWIGMGKFPVYTAAGLVQLATFPIPVDFPNIGLGLHIPNQDCPGRHTGSSVPPDEVLPA